MINKPTVSFIDFLQNVDKTFLEHQASRSDGKISAANQWRYGQTVMNVLYEVWPEKYKEISNSEYNCFYTNALVKDALSKLEKEWHD